MTSKLSRFLSWLNNFRNHWSDHLELAEDPLASKIVYPLKYFQSFHYFISQVSKIIVLSYHNTIQVFQLA